MNHPFVNCNLPISHLVAISYQIDYCGFTTVKWSLFYFIMAPRHQSSDAGNLHMSKRSCKVLKWKGRSSRLNKERKKKNHMLRLLRSMVRMNLLFMKSWQSKGIHASFIVTLRMTKVTAAAHDTCSVKIEKSLNLYRVFEREWDHIQITFIVVYCYHYSVLLLTVVNCLLWLTYKLNCIMGI